MMAAWWRFRLGWRRWGQELLFEVAAGLLLGFQQGQQPGLLLVGLLSLLPQHLHPRRHGGIGRVLYRDGR
jgi:hypothetical protein